MQTSFIERKLAAWLMRQTATSGVRKVASVRGAIASELGNVREDNQDKAVIVKGVQSNGNQYTIAIVADGIGGMRDGAKCAALGVASFVAELTTPSITPHLRPELWIEAAMHRANESVYSFYRGHGGTTFVVTLIEDGKQPIWASAGDSRLYSFDKKQLRQVSVDDTIAGQLRKHGPVPSEHTKILQYVGMGRDFSPHVERLSSEPDDILLLTTDGVHFLAEESNILRLILQNSTEAGVSAKRFVDLAKWCGGPDNATIVIVPCQSFLGESDIDEADGLAVWDAFGELQLHIRKGYSQREETPKMLSSPNRRASNPENDHDEDDVKLIETDSDKSSVPKPDLPEPKRKSRKRSAKKKTEDNGSAPQLDIKFSTKPE